MRSLGICWIFYGVWRLVLAAMLVLGSGTATMMFGAVLTRVADPYSLMATFHALYTGAILLSLLCAVLGILAGLSLQGREESGRRMHCARFAVFAARVAAWRDDWVLHAVSARARSCFARTEIGGKAQDYCGGATVPTPIFVVDPKRL